MVNITNIDPNTLTLQTISPEDVSIIPNTTITSSFNPVDVELNILYMILIIILYQLIMI
jgi:hypothetical protein